MANKTVSNLNELTTVSNSDVLLVETATETLKVTKGNLLKEVNEQLNAKSNASHTHDEYVTENELNSKGLATETFVTNKIAEASLNGGDVDLSGYATKEELSNKSDKTHNHSYNDLTDKPTIPSLDGYATESFVTQKIAEASFGNTEGSSVVLMEPNGNDVPKVFFNGVLPTTKDSTTMGFEYASRTKRIKGYVDIKCQGTSSMSYDKKNFTIKLYADEAKTIKVKEDFKGWGKQQKFCLKANYVDTTHTRNISGARVAYDMVESRAESEFKTNLQSAPRNGAIDGFPIKVFVNGMFYGIYTWNIPKDAWMFNMDEDNPNHMVLCAEENAGWGGNTTAISSCQFRTLWDGGESWSVEVGTLTDAMKRSFNNAISHVMNSADADFKANLGNYFDVDSLIDYYIFSYFMCHIDGLAKNMLMATYDGVHWGACLYDMDSIYGGDWNGVEFKPYNTQCPKQYQETNSLLWQRLEANFSQEIYDRYIELRKGALSLGNIVSHVEYIYDLLSDRDLTEEHNKWTGLPSVSTNTIPRFREFMNKRATWVDEQMMKFDTTPIPVISISIPSTSTLAINQTKTLEVTYNPTNTNQKGVTWSIDSETYATIDSSTGLITPLGIGSCVITATSTTNTNASASCTLTIVDASTISNASYMLSEPLVLHGSNHLDTGIPLFDTNKAITMYVDYTPTFGSYSNEPTLLHCVKEVNPWCGFSLGVHNNMYRIFYPTVNSYHLGISSNSVDNQKFIIKLLPETGTIYYYNCVNNNEYTDYNFNIAENHTKTLMIGCKKDEAGTLSNHWTGTINKFVLWFDDLSNDSVLSQIRL
nr:MAG TPA: CotH kinase protein [Bacteriophage sp.]